MDDDVLHIANSLSSDYTHVKVGVYLGRAALLELSGEPIQFLTFRTEDPTKLRKYVERLAERWDMVFASSPSKRRAR